MAKGIIDRLDYSKGILMEAHLDESPLAQLRAWLQEAARENVKIPDAMTLATIDKQGHPDARVVLLKHIDEKGFTFFTHYNSVKGLHLETHKHVAAVFFWPELERQIRIRGYVEKLTSEESDAYFATRPRDAQLSAHAAKQSSSIPSREFLEQQLSELEHRFPHVIPRPLYWGGYRIIPEEIEFWQGRPGRLHDRFLYTKQNAAWTVSRLAP